jgi:phage FluMu protein Com
MRRRGELETMKMWIELKKKPNGYFFKLSHEFIGAEMSDVIQMRELSSDECEKVLRGKKFYRHKPVTCTRCGNENGFRIKLYQVTGIKAFDDENEQGCLQYHLQQRFGFSSVIFRVSGRKNYIETAFCKKCGSNDVVFDIEFTDEILKEMSRKLNIPAEQIKRGLYETVARIESNKRSS